MKGQVFWMGILGFVLLTSTVFSRNIAPVVSEDWLQDNIGKPGITILDVRKVEHYKEGHVPGAINLYFGAWSVHERDLDCELPQNDDLSDLVRSAGLAKESLVVLVGSTTSERDLVSATRTAWTLKSLIHHQK